MNNYFLIRGEDSDMNNRASEITNAIKYAGELHKSAEALKSDMPGGGSEDPAVSALRGPGFE